MPQHDPDNKLFSMQTLERQRQHRMRLKSLLMNAQLLLRVERPSLKAIPQEQSEAPYKSVERMRDRPSLIAFRLAW